MNSVNSIICKPNLEVTKVENGDANRNSETKASLLDASYESDIVNSIGIKTFEYESFLTVSERYYNHKYCAKVPHILENIHQKVSFHTNRVCLISLAEDHPVITENKDIVKVNFKVNEKLDRLQNKVSGKSKRGAQKLNRNSIICYVECSDNSIYPVYSCIDGKLLEINDKLISDPNLLKTKPVTDGYIALLLPVLNIYEDMKNSMLTKEKYFV